MGIENEVKNFLDNGLSKQSSQWLDRRGSPLKEQERIEANWFGFMGLGFLDGQNESQRVFYTASQLKRFLRLKITMSGEHRKKNLIGYSIDEALSALVLRGLLVDDNGVEIPRTMNSYHKFSLKRTDDATRGFLEYMVKLGESGKVNPSLIFSYQQRLEQLNESQL